LLVVAREQEKTNFIKYKKKIIKLKWDIFMMENSTKKGGGPVNF